MTMQTFTGEQYLAIDIANNFGLDKKNWNVRLDWFNSVEPQLEKLVPQAENPALFYAGVQAWRAHQRGEATGYPISLDACSSGLQLLACLIGDRQAAKICNVVGGEDDEDNRNDAYTVIYETMCEVLGESGKIQRSEVKQAVMTSLYGSEAVPKRVFGEGSMLDIFEGVMALMAPGAWELNKAFLSLWDPEASKYSWVLPDNFHVHIKVKDVVKENIFVGGAPVEVFQKVNQPTKTGRSLGANAIHSIDGYVVREMVRRCNYDKERLLQVKSALCFFGYSDETELTHDDLMVNILWNQYKKTGLLSARILDHINEDNVHQIDKREVVWELIYSMPLKPFELLTIHDCFRCLPAYGNDLRVTYNRILAEIAKSHLLDSILSQITGREIVTEKQDPNMWQEILGANYALS